MSAATREFFLCFALCRATTRLKQTTQASELLMGTLLLYKGWGTKGGGDLQPLNYQTRISDIEVLVLSIPMYAGVACFLGALSLALYLG